MGLQEVTYMRKGPDLLVCMQRPWPRIAVIRVCKSIRSIPTAAAISLQNTADAATFGLVRSQPGRK